ncbi:MAG: hypothetical protein ABI725_04680 [Chloroflexota bacterium]
MSSFWRRAFKVQYRLLAWFDPVIRAVWHRFGIGNILELRVAGRDGKGERSRLVGLLHGRDGLYLGHPNGDVGWTRDLEAAGEGVLRYPNGAEWQFSAARLPAGDEREQAIRATGQHPFPGNLVYRLGRKQVRAAGVFFGLRSKP